MPRCDTCMRMLPSSGTRKLPGRDAYRCKDKFDCLLAETNRDAWTVTFAITYPAKDEREAREIASGLNLKPFPMQVLNIERRLPQNAESLPAEALS